VENSAVKVILRVCAALAVLGLALLAILFVLGIVPGEIFKQATMKLLGVSAIVAATLMALARIVRK
jgi:hypothetical protein